MAALRLHFILSTLSVLLTTCAIAQQQPPFRFTHLGLENGLPTTVITALAEDSTGMVWVGTRGGLARYDGSGFEIFRSSRGDPCAITSDNILSCFVSRSGTVYVTGLSDWSRFDPDSHCFVNYSPPDSLTGDGRKDLTCLWTAQDTVIWLGSYAGLIRYSVHTKRYSLFPMPWPSLPGHDQPVSVHAIQPDPVQSCELLLATSRGVVRFDCDKLQYDYAIPVPAGAWPDISPTCLLAGPGNRLWLGLWGNGLAEYLPGRDTWRFYHTEEGSRHEDPVRGVVPWDLVRAILPDGDHLLLGFHRGLGFFNIRSGTLELFNHQPADASTINSNTVTALLRHSCGRIFVGTLNGLDVTLAPGLQPLRLDPAKDYGTIPHLRKIDPSGGLILGKPVILDQESVLYADQKAGGLHRFDRRTGKSSFIDLTRRPGPPFQTADMLQVAPDKLLISGREGLYDFSLSRETLSSNHSPLGELVRDLDLYFPRLLRLSDNTLVAWDREHLVGSDLQAGITTLSFPWEGIPYVSTIIPMGDTALLVWSGQDAWRLRHKDQCVTPVAQSHRMEFEARYGIIAHQDLWIGSWGGLSQYRLSGDSLRLVRRFTTADGLPSNILHPLNLDAKGRLWGGTDTGLFRVDTASGFIRTFNSLDGIAFPLVDQEIAFFEDGTALFNDHRYVYMLSSGPGQGSRARCYFRSLECGDSTYFDTSRPILLSPGTRSLSASFGVIDHIYGPRNSMYYQLAGFDSDWQQAGRDRTCRYTNLEPGEYSLRVRARTPDGIYTPEIRATLVFLPALYERTWFFPSLAGLLVLAVILLVRLRLHRLRRKERQASMIRQQLADLELRALRAQMNPHFMFNSMNSIKSYILQADSAKAADYLSRFAYLIRLILQYSGERSITVKEELDMNLRYIELEKLRLRDSFEFSCFIGEQVDLKAVSIPPMLLQPHVENAIWHGLQHKDGDRRLRLSFDRINGVLRCRIEDNGIGRQAARALEGQSMPQHRSMGMQIARDRIAIMNQTRQAGIELQIQDLYDADGQATGTRVDIFLPYESCPDR